MNHVTVSFTPKGARLKELVAAAKQTKTLQELFAKALESFLQTEDGVKMESSLKTMAAIKSGLVAPKEEVPGEVVR